MFRQLRRQLCPDLAIDLGTANTRIAVAGEGIALDEPSVVALRHGTRQVLGRGTAVGRLAKQMLGRTPEGVTAVRPIRCGVVADFEVCEAMLRYFFAKAGRSGLGMRPRVIIAVPAAITPVERRAVFNAAERAGAGEVLLLDQAFAAGIGTGLPVAEPIASMVCDLGAGTTEISVFSLGETVASFSLRVGGDEFDEAIAESLRRTYSLVVGPQTAERLKLELGSALPLDLELTEEVGGRDGVSNAARKALVTSEDVREALQGPLQRIVAGVRSAIEKCSPEIVADLSEQGLVLTGGGALLRKIDPFLSNELGIPVRVGREPLQAVVTGASVCVDHFAAWRNCLDAGERAA
jgi:rod shape-determining protein MreB